MSNIIEVKNLTRYFGGLTAVNNVSFSVKENEILSIIGPNGAGKSTLFKLISSFLRVSSGEVFFNGEKISNLQPHIVARKGVIRTFQEMTIFKDMTVRDNVITAHHLRSKASLLGYFFKTKTSQQDELAFAESADEILTFLRLNTVAEEFASNLPQGSLRALGIAIGLAANPKVLLLDEPFAGMNSDETNTMVDLINQVRNRGVTVLLVEHDMQAVMKISDRIVVINFGEKIAEGKPEIIQKNQQVIDAYLGSDDFGIH